MYMNGLKVLVCALAVVVGNAVMANYSETVNGYEWSYTVYSGTATVTGVSPATGAVSIPSTLGGCHVTRIRGRAFEGSNGLKSVSSRLA